MKKGLGNFKIRKGVFYPLCAIYLIVILLGVRCFRKWRRQLSRRLVWLALSDHHDRAGRDLCVGSGV